MNLKEFVAETLSQIVGGVHEAAKRVSELGTNAAVNPKTLRSFADDPTSRTSEVSFDVALTVSEQADATSTDKVGASAGLLSVVSAKISGESGNETVQRQRNETVSRVRFSVPLAMPSDIDDRREETRRSQEAATRKIRQHARRI